MPTTTATRRRASGPWPDASARAGTVRVRLAALLLTYGLLAASATTVYCVTLIVVGAARSASAVPGPWWAHVLAAALVAATVEPARRWLARGVEDVLGAGRDPYDAVTAVHRHLESAQGSAQGSAQAREQEPVASLAATLARALDVPCLHVVVPGEQVEASGSPPPGTTALAVGLRFDGERLGEIRAWPRRRGSPLTEADVALLRDLGDQVALGLVARRAARAAQSSREALVSAREEERRRLRRDLHDGLGPTLASLRLQLAALARLLPDGSDAARAVVADLLGDVRTATGDVRRIVDDLRPALLDDLGLTGALAASVAACEASGVSVQMRLDALPELPAAVEVAAYRVATEALLNVTRHAGAHGATLTVAADGDYLRVTVTDDGTGLPEPLVPGVGLRSMRERAEELGGTLEVGPMAPRGTQVRAVLPLTRPGGP